MMQHRKLVFALVCCSFLIFSGCGMFSSAKKKTFDWVGGLGFGDAKNDYMKTVALDDFKFNPVWAHLKAPGLFNTPLSESMAKECNNTRLVISGKPDFPEQLAIALMKSDGKPDSFSLAITGQAFGINAIIVPKLMDITVNEKVKGIFWFRDTHHKAKIHTDVVAFHTGTGAKLFDETIYYEIEIDEPSAAQIKQRQWPDSVSFLDAMNEAAEITAEMICETLAETPWEGYISAVHGDQVRLPFGEAHNLKVGDTLDVFSIKDILEGAEQQRYFVPGLKTGQIILTAVSSFEAIGKVVEGGKVQPNSIVRSVQNK